MKNVGWFLLFCLMSPTVPAAENYTQYVDPLIGTGEHGHTYPGAVLPFGLVQLSPDTRYENWDGSSGYHYSDSTILGFSHTHLSGTGEPEYCDVLLMPTVGAVQLSAGDEANSQTGYRSHFRHENEFAAPGYYRVRLDDDQITAELTATLRTGFHRYTFPQTDRANIIFDLQHRGKTVAASIEVIDDSTIAGLRHSTGWAVDQKVWFYAQFSEPFKTFGIAVQDSLMDGIRKAEAENVKAYFRFDTRKNNQVLVRIGISAVSPEGARKNLLAENSTWDFDAIRARANQAWNAQLSKIAVTGGTEKQKRIFYTAMYHAALAPNIFTDVDNNFRGVDQHPHQAEGYVQYTIFSLWDVFRAQMPLFTIIEPQRTRDFIRSFLDIYQTAGRLPRWEIWGTLSGHMIGNHALPVILDAWVKGIQDFDIELAYQAMKAQMNSIAYYNNLGFIPADIEGTGGSVAICVEYAFNHWCVAELARRLGKAEDFLLFQTRSQYYRNLFDAETGFMRPKNGDYTWVTPFDPAEPSGHYVEGNSFQYSAYVPHDVNGLIALQGGDRGFVAWLDTLFTHQSQYDKNVVDAAGLIGQYAHGNEPSHQIAFLYNYAGATWKTQKLARQIANTLYDDNPEGLSGNEDCGQISGWYILNALGFYPVQPGNPMYAIGSPIFDQATIHLENGKQFCIQTRNNSDANVYIQSAKLNGKPYSRSWLSHGDILAGGKIVFEMGPEPNRNWGTAVEDRPRTEKFVPFVSLPWYKVAENYFFKEATISLGCETPGAQIYYTLDGSEPDESSRLYSKPFRIFDTRTLKFMATKPGLLSTTVVSVEIEKQAPIEVTLLTNYDHLNLQPGLKYKYYENNVLYVDELEAFEPKKTGITPYFSIEDRDQDGLFGFIWSGFIKIPRDGIYTFSLSSNDGGVLYLDGARFIDLDGPHTAMPKSRTIALKAGTYQIAEKYFQMGGGYSNTVTWKGPGIRKEVIPPSVLFHAASGE